MRSFLLACFFAFLFVVCWELLAQIMVGTDSQGGRSYSLIVQSSDGGQLKAFAESLYLECGPLNLEYADGGELRVVGLTLDDARNVRRAIELNIEGVQVEMQASL